MERIELEAAILHGAASARPVAEPVKSKTRSIIVVPIVGRVRLCAHERCVGIWSEMGAARNGRLTDGGCCIGPSVWICDGADEEPPDEHNKRVNAPLQGELILLWCLWHAAVGYGGTTHRVVQGRNCMEDAALVLLELVRADQALIHRLVQETQPFDRRRDPHPGVVHGVGPQSCARWAHVRLLPWLHSTAARGCVLHGAAPNAPGAGYGLD